MSEWHHAPSMYHISPWQCAWWVEADSVKFVLQIGDDYFVCLNPSQSNIGDKVAGPFPTLEAAKVAYLMMEVKRYGG